MYAREVRLRKMKKLRCYFGVEKLDGSISLVTKRRNKIDSDVMFMRV